MRTQQNQPAKPAATSRGAQLSVPALMAQARDTSPHDDFGDPWFMEPLGRLVAAINQEAGLLSPDEAPVQRIVQSLRDRLGLVALIKQHPEIREEQVNVAGAILGLPRTGSTMLHRLLGSSPQLTAGFWWEVMFPLPFPGEEPGAPAPREEAAKELVASFLATWPDFTSIHPIDAMAHDEDIMLLDRTFLSTTYDSIMNIPSYGMWLAGAEMVAAYEELKLWLQVLQTQAPERRRQRWILKSPHHLLGGLHGMMTVFPEAKMIMTHRAVEALIPSYCSMCASMTVAHSSSFNALELGEYWSRRFRLGIEDLMAARLRQPDRFVDVRYADMLVDPLAQVVRVFEALGLDATDADYAAFNEWLRANPRDARPPHRYTPEEFGLSQARIAENFAFYTSAFALS